MKPAEKIIDPLKPKKRPWKEFVADWEGCDRCPLGDNACNHVLGRGTTKKPDLLMIGEAPGRSEDVLGKPFVGQAGDLFKSCVEKVQQKISFTYYVTNVLACIPRPDEPGQGSFRQPRASEAESCAPRLLELVKQLSPQGIVLMGNVAQQYCRKFPERTGYYKTSTRTRKIKGILGELPNLSIRHPAFWLRRGGGASPEYARSIVQLVNFLKLLKEKQ